MITRNELLNSIESLKNICIQNTSQISDLCSISNNTDKYIENINELKRKLLNIVNSVSKNDNINELFKFDNIDVCQKYSLKVHSKLESDLNSDYILNTKIPFNKIDTKFYIEIKKKIDDVFIPYCTNESMKDTLYGDNYLTREDIIKYSSIYFIEILNLVSCLLTIILGDDYETENISYFENKLNSILKKEKEDYIISICNSNYHYLTKPTEKNITTQFKILDKFRNLFLKNGEINNEDDYNTKYEKLSSKIGEEILEKETELKKTNMKQYKLKNMIGENTVLCYNKNNDLKINENDKLQDDFKKSLLKDIDELRYLYLRNMIDLIDELIGNKDISNQKNSLLVYCNMNDTLNDSIERNVTYVSEKLIFKNTNDLIGKLLIKENDNIMIKYEDGSIVYLMKNNETIKDNKEYRIIRILDEKDEELVNSLVNIDKLKIEVEYNENKLILSYDNKQIDKVEEFQNGIWRINFNIDYDVFQNTKKKIQTIISNLFFNFEDKYISIIEKLKKAYSERNIIVKDELSGGKNSNKFTKKYMKRKKNSKKQNNYIKKR